MTLQWVSADARTGRVLADLPGLSVDPSAALRRSISNYDTATATLNLGGAGLEWERASVPGGAVLACYDDADSTAATPGPIPWAGLVTQRTRNVGTSQVALSLLTAEGYFDRRYVGDATWASTLHRDDLIATVLNTNVAEGVEPGLPMQLAYTPGGGPVLGVQTVWQNTDNASVLTRLTEIAGQWGGEFTVEWQWSDDNTSIFPVAHFGDRVGTATKPGLTPAVVFESPGSVADAQLVEDYSTGFGATKVVAYGAAPSGSTVTPYAQPVYAAASSVSRPTFEYRYAPSSGTPVVLSLAAYAKKKLADLANGGQAFTFTLSRDPSATLTRRVGVDWRLGDDIGCIIQPCDAFPAGYAKTGRVIAYEVTDTTVTPVFADPATYSQGG